MASKKRNHFVPQFYLRRFASCPKRINVFNLRRGLSIQNTSLRDQCYKHRFYGDTSELEDAFAKIEGHIAPVLRRIDSSGTGPLPGSDDFYWLMMFVASQVLRTTGAVKRVMQGHKAMLDAAFRDHPEQRWPEPDESESLTLSLRTLSYLVDALDDLVPHVIKTGLHGNFVTSDNPVYQYNQYCEGIVGAGVTGGLCRGLQVFLPLSPHTAILLYDSAVYKVGRRGTATSSVATEADIGAINTMQFVAANQNVFFSSWEQRSKCKQMSVEARKLRRKNVVRVTEAIEVGNELSSLLHHYEQMPDLKVGLSFMTVRRAARRIKRHKRMMLYRKPFPDDLSIPPDPADDGRRRVFRIPD